MPSIQIKPEGVPWVSPYLLVRNVNEAIAFYQNAFGFRPGPTYGEPGTPVSYGEVFHHDALIMLGLPEDGKHHPAGDYHGLTLYCYTPDVDVLAARARAAGATLRHAPEDQFWGDRTCLLIDPDGHAWMWATHLRAAASESAHE
jgi:uncharacterized glyoxalase superfamily protein PhnB